MSNRFDMMNISNSSTNRLLSENENITAKYNQYKRSLLGITPSPNRTSSDLHLNSVDNYLLCNAFPEKETDTEKFHQLKKAYDERITSLYNNLRLIAKNLEHDEMLNTMKNDSTRDRENNEFVTQRMREIIDENVLTEKEELIRQLSEENAELRTKFQNNYKFDNKINHLEGLLNESYQKNEMLQAELANMKTQLINMQQGFELELKKVNDEYLLRLTKSSNDNHKLKNENLQYIDSITFYENNLKELNSEYEENKLEMDRLQKVISVLEIDLNQSETKVKEKQTRVEALQHELTNLQTQYFEASLKYKKFMDENKSLQSLVDHFEKERKEMLDKYSSFNDEMKKSQHEHLDTWEKKNKEKNQMLKKKIVELKEVITNLEEELKQEKNKLMNTKLQYSKVYTDMQEGMKVISNEWEKKLKDETLHYEKIVSELENKHATELNNLKHDHMIEIENKNKEIAKHKQSSDMLKNFDKEYIRINDHEEIVNQTVLDIRKKFDKELQQKEIDMENELRRRLIKLEEDKKGEYEFLTDNTRRNLKNIEQLNEELKSKCIDLQSRLSLEKENNETLSNSNNNMQKSIRTLNSQLEDKTAMIKNHMEKIQNYEERLEEIFMSNKNLNVNLENLHCKLNSKDKEINSLLNELKEKEEMFNEELNKMQKHFHLYKEEQFERHETEVENTQILSTKLKKAEDLIETLGKENNFLNEKASRLEKDILNYEQAYEEITLRLKGQENELESTRGRTFELTKSLKNTTFERKNTNELITKLMKTKLTTIREEIASIKSYYSNELSNIKKEHAKTIETLFSKIKLFTLHFDRQLEIQVNNCKEVMEKEYHRKLDEKDLEKSDDIKKIEHKYEKHLLEQFRINEKLEKENKNLNDTIHSQVLKLKETTFKLQEIETENKNFNNSNNKLKVEIDLLNEIIEKHRLEKFNMNKTKMENEEMGEHARRETIRKLQGNLSNLLLVIVKLKKRYTGEIQKLKDEVEGLARTYEGQISSLTKSHGQEMEKLEEKLSQEREGHMKIKKQVENKEKEFTNIQRDLDKLKEIYENKIKLLSSRINKDEGNLNEIKEDIDGKNEQIKNLTTVLQESKNQMKALKTQLELKSDEILNFKNEYEKLVRLKDKKIHDLQSIVNQSLYSYNSGLNNIKIANKLDDEVKVLMKRAKIEEINDDLYTKK